MKVFRGKGSEAVLLAFIAICIVALLSRIYAFPELPVQILASVFGVVLTVLVTYLLLGGQSKSEEDLQKSSKVFEEKLKVYKEFMSVLYEAVHFPNHLDSLVRRLMALMDIRAIYPMKNGIRALLFHAFGAAPLVLRKPSIYLKNDLALENPRR